MKKILLAVLATLGLLTATGQQLQYREDYLLPHYMAKGCVNFESYHTHGAGNDYALGYAQPFFIDSAISVKGIAASMLIFRQPEIMNFGEPLYLQIRDSTLTQVLAQIRYDTVLTIRRTPDLNRPYIEELFNRSILIHDSKFYIVAIFPEALPHIYPTDVGFEVTNYYRDSNCYDGNYPVLIWEGKNEEWLPANVYDSLQYVQAGLPYPESEKKSMPFEMFVFPILGTIANDSTDTNGHNSIGQVDLEKYTYLYPNPATHEITIVSSVGLTKVEVFNMAGIKVYEQETKANSLTVNVSAFAKRAYIAVLHTQHGIVKKKFIVR